jgi:hypothetical protein
VSQQPARILKSRLTVHLITVSLIHPEPLLHDSMNQSVFDALTFFVPAAATASGIRFNH